MKKKSIITIIKWLYRKAVRSSARYDHITLAFLAVLLGAVVSYAAIGFRFVIEEIELVSYTTSVLFEADIPPWRMAAIPIIGGIIVALMLKFLRDGRRAESIAEVIEANALKNGQMSIKSGITSALVTSVSIGCGSSTGREGPVVHLGATLASFLRDRLHLTDAVGRTLLACGVAAAVASSFNAPIAGVFFALEVVIGHYAIHTFAPVVIAAVIATIISRVQFGDFPAFIIPDLNIVSSLEIPAFIMLGILSAMVAILFIRSVEVADNLAMKIPVPEWSLPIIGGFFLGGIALFLPEVLGVGYHTTDNALHELYSIQLLALLMVAKIAATALSLGFRFGGGVFSPALFLGAMGGGAFGILATSIFPDLGSTQGVYSIVGMGAVAAAILGAPISTILIVFEMTGNYSITIVVMVASAVATLIARLYGFLGFFHWQLERRGLQLGSGRANYLLKSMTVKEHLDEKITTVTRSASITTIRKKFFANGGGNLYVVNDDNQLYGVITAHELSNEAFEEGIDTLIYAEDICRINPLSVSLSDNLETTIKLLEGSGEDHLPVVNDAKELCGQLHYRDVIAFYNQALAETVREQHASTYR